MLEHNACFDHRRTAGWEWLFPAATYHLQTGLFVYFWSYFSQVETAYLVLSLEKYVLKMHTQRGWRRSSALKCVFSVWDNLGSIASNKKIK